MKVRDTGSHILCRLKRYIYAGAHEQSIVERDNKEKEKTFVKRDLLCPPSIENPVYQDKKKNTKIKGGYNHAHTVALTLQKKYKNKSLECRDLINEIGHTQVQLCGENKGGIGKTIDRIQKGSGLPILRRINFFADNILCEENIKLVKELRDLFKEGLREHFQKEIKKETNKETNIEKWELIEQKLENANLEAFLSRAKKMINTQPQSSLNDVTVKNQQKRSPGC